MREGLEGSRMGILSKYCSCDYSNTYKYTSTTTINGTTKSSGINMKWLLKLKVATEYRTLIFSSSFSPVIQALCKLLIIMATEKIQSNFHCSFPFLPCSYWGQALSVYYKLFHKQALCAPEFTPLSMPFRNRMPICPNLFINILLTLWDPAERLPFPRSLPQAFQLEQLAAIYTSTYTRVGT